MKEEHAFMSESFPCNAIPFLTRIREILDKGNTNAFDSLSAEGKLKARACMWILLGQLYGQTATINLSEEWSYLNASKRMQDIRDSNTTK